MMERTQVKELVFGSSSLLFSAKCGIISLFISYFSPSSILAVYTQAAVIFLGALFASSNLPLLLALIVSVIICNVV